MKPRSDYLDDRPIAPLGPPTVITVDATESGLLDAHGNKLLKRPAPVGYLAKKQEWFAVKDDK